MSKWEWGWTDPRVKNERYEMIHMFDGTYNIVRGNPYYNPPAVKTGLTREEALAFMKLLK